jgi:hypothetical protein
LSDYSRRELTIKYLQSVGLSHGILKAVLRKGSIVLPTDAMMADPYPQTNGFQYFDVNFHEHVGLIDHGMLNFVI